MRVLILGDATLNNGPSNVHRALIQHWPCVDMIDCVRAQGKVRFVLEGLMKGVGCDVVISPCMDMPGIVTQQMLHAMGKPIVCFNHGYVPFENEINGLGHGSRWIDMYKDALRKADYIVCNSLLQEHFVLERQPELQGKVGHIHLGIDRFAQRKPQDSRETIVAVSGGSRAIKGNDTVVRACRQLREQGLACRLRVYGSFDQGAESLRDLMHPEYDEEVGQVAHEDFMDGLASCSLFVMNSRHEPFGLSAIDAIQAGVSLLVSRNCGIDEVLGLEEGDIVGNPDDVDEVTEKMACLIGHPNAQRIYESIDFDALSWDVQATKLREVCADCLKPSRRMGARR